MDQRGIDVLEKMRASRGGFVLLSHEFMAGRDPDFLEGYEGMYASCNGPKSPLPKKIREFVLMASDLCLGVSPDVVGAHAKNAMAEGATEAEVTAVFELAMLAYSAKAMAIGVSALRDHAG